MKGPFAGPKRAPREPDWLPRKLRVIFRGGPEGEFAAEVDPHAEYWNRCRHVPNYWPDGMQVLDLEGLPSVTILRTIDIYRREIEGGWKTRPAWRYIRYCARHAGIPIPADLLAHISRGHYWRLLPPPRNFG